MDSPKFLVNMIKRFFQPCPVVVLLIYLILTNPVGSADGDADLGACSILCKYQHDFSSADCKLLGLTEIPSVAGLCSNARELHLEENNINAVHSTDLLEYTSLRFLYLGENEISEITPNMFNSTTVENLDLNNNNIRTIASNAFSQLPALKELVLDSNGIDDLRSDAFSGVSKLRTLQLHDNNITDVASNVFANLVSLLTLNLARNNIHQISKGSISGLNRLQRLILSNNHISKLDVDIFRNLNKLNILALSGNHLMTVDADMFRELPLQEVYLTNNNITTVTHLGEWLSENKSLSTLALADNPLHCDCYMEPLRVWLLERNLEDDLTTCASPAEFRGMRLVDIQQTLCPNVMTTQNRYSPGVGAGRDENSVGSDDTWKIIIVACVVFMALVALVGGFVLILKRRGTWREQQQEPDSVHYSSVNQSAPFDSMHRRRITSETQLMSDDSSAYESYTIPPDARDFNQQRPARNGFVTPNVHPRAPLVKQASTGSVTTSPDISIAITPNINSSPTKQPKFTISEPDIPELEFDADGNCTSFGQTASAAGRTRRTSPPLYPPPPPPTSIAGHPPAPTSNAGHHGISSPAPLGTNTGYLPLPNLQNVTM